MKSIGKIGLLLISFFIVSSVFLFINIETYGIDGGMRFGAIQLLLIIGIPWFISYSKWANDNIWNIKTSKPTNTSYTSSKDVVEPIEETIEDNHDILGNINLPSLNNAEENNSDILEKIEELKRQIESLESSLNTNDSSTQSNDEKKEDENYTALIVIIVLGILTMLALVANT